MAWTAGAAAFVLFAATASRTVPFGDGGELVAAAAGWGVAHPPGYPLYTTLGHAALSVPLGEPAWRMAVVSAIFGALVVSAVGAAVARMTRSSAGALAAGGALAVHPTFWSVSTVPEVYTMHLALEALLLGLAWRAGASEGRSRSFAILGVGTTLGLGLAHHPTIVLAVPAAAVLAYRTGSRRSAPWTTLVGAFTAATVIPALAYASLLPRARWAPESSWGHLATAGDLIAHATAASYRFYDLGWAGIARPEAWRQLGGLVGPSAWGAVGVAAVAGAVPAWRRGSLRRPALGLVLLLLATVAFGLRYETEDAQVYFLPALAVVAVFAGCGVATLGNARGLGAALAWGAAVLVVAWPFGAHLRSRDLSRVTAAADYGRDVLDTLPVGSILFVDGDDGFVIAYLRNVLGERADLVVYDRTGGLFRDLLRDPGPPMRPGEDYAAYRARRETSAVLDAVRSRPDRGVYFTTWPGYDLPPGYGFEPVGLLHRVVRDGFPPRDDASLWAEYHAEAVRGQAVRVGDPYGLALAANYDLMRGERAFFLGRPGDAERHLEAAARIGGSTEAIRNAIGVAYGRRGDLARAAREFEEAVRLHPTSTRAWANLAHTLELGGDAAGADAARRRLATIEGR